MRITGGVQIIGDIHGQYYDMCNLLKNLGVGGEGGDPGILKYVFLGDYVDRGMFGVEVLVLLLALKVNYPH